jgi:hypothetical protein
MARVTVKVALLEYVPSDTVTVWGPAVAAGTANVQKLKPPLALVVQDVETLLPSKRTVIGANSAKPLPLAMAVLPTVPVLGTSQVAGLTV